MKKWLLGCMILFCIYSCEKENNEKKPSDVSFETTNVNVIYQGSDQAIWVGTSSGLYKHQTGEWYDYSTEISGKEVLDITQYNSSLWLATVDGLLRITRDGHSINITTTFDNSNTCLKSNRVQALGISPDDRLWAGTSKGICYYNGDEWTDDEISEIRGLNASSFAFDQSDYYIGTYGDYLYHYYSGEVDGNSGASYLIPPFNGELSTDTVFCSLIDEEGNLWFGSTQGLTRNRNGTHVMNGSFTYYLEELHVYDVHIGEGIYAGTQNGLHLFDGNTWKVISKNDGLPGDTVISIYPDENGDVWIGTTEGLAKLTDGIVYTY